MMMREVVAAREGIGIIAASEEQLKRELIAMKSQLTEAPTNRHRNPNLLFSLSLPQPEP